MRARIVILLIVIALIAVFAALNWNEFMRPAPLSLAFDTVTAPLGLVMLCITAAVAVIFLLSGILTQSAVLLEKRQWSRELREQRDLASRAEASRFTELRTALDERLGALAEQLRASELALTSRSDRLEAELRTSVEHTGNTLSAYIGEVEDRLEQFLAARTVK
jgi:DNA anti-recombination protein RmuC